MMVDRSAPFFDLEVRIARLLSAGLQPPIVSDELHVPLKAVTAVRKKAGLMSRPGQCPTARRILEKPRARLSGAIVIYQYGLMTTGRPKTTSTVDLDALLGIYAALRTSPLADIGVILRELSLTQAWVLLNGLACGTVQRRACQSRPRCHVEYPIAVDAHYATPPCPFCSSPSLFPNRRAHPARAAKRRTSRRTPIGKNTNYAS